MKLKNRGPMRQGVNFKKKKEGGISFISAACNGNGSDCRDSINSCSTTFIWVDMLLNSGIGIMTPVKVAVMQHVVSCAGLPVPMRGLVSKPAGGVPAQAVSQAKIARFFSFNLVAFFKSCLAGVALRRALQKHGRCCSMVAQQ